MYQIQLHDLVFHAKHGMYAEETVTGNRFELTVDLQFFPTSPIKSLRDCIDYVTVYDCIAGHMQQPEALLEVLAANLADAIYALDRRVAHISIQIFKTSVPIKGFTGKVGVSFAKDYTV